MQNLPCMDVRRPAAGPSEWSVRRDGWQIEKQGTDWSTVELTEKAEGGPPWEGVCVVAGGSTSSREPRARESGTGVCYGRRILASALSPASETPPTSTIMQPTAGSRCSNLACSFGYRTDAFQPMNHTPGRHRHTDSIIPADRY